MNGSARPNLSNLKQYMPGKPADEVERELQLSDVVKLASNENPLGPSPKAVIDLKNKLAETHIYPDQKAILLREALSSRVGLPIENIIVGNGSDEIMLLVAEAFLSAGEEVIISENTFSLYESVSNIMDGKIKYVPLKNYRYDIDSIGRVVTENTKLVWICSPNNPTGTITIKKELDELLLKVPQNTIVVIDEAYGEYVQSRDYPNTLNYIREGKNIIVLRTFSKIFGMAGLRVGYGIGKSDLIKYLNMVRLPFNVGRLSQSAAVAAIDDKDFVKASIKNNQDGKKYLYGELKKLKIDFVETEANFIMLNLEQSADEIFMLLMKQGVIIRPLTSFGLPNSIRVTVGTPIQNKRFIDSLKEVLS